MQFFFFFSYLFQPILLRAHCPCCTWHNFWWLDETVSANRQWSYLHLTWRGYMNVTRGACMSKAPSSAKGAVLRDEGFDAEGYFQETTAELTVVEAVGWWERDPTHKSAASTLVKCHLGTTVYTKIIVNNSPFWHCHVSPRSKLPPPTASSNWLYCWSFYARVGVPG